MVSVTHAASFELGAPPLDLLSDALDPAGRECVREATNLADSLYADQYLGTGESAGAHALGMALIASSLRLDVEARVAALLFSACEYRQDALALIEQRFGKVTASLVDGLRRLNGLRLITRMAGEATAPEIRAQKEVLRKMLLAMTADIRVVLLKLISRTQTLRYFSQHKEKAQLEVARESLDIYAPLANRLGIGQLKWELEDLSFRFLEPETYKRVAQMLDERRSEREAFIQHAIEQLHAALAEAGIDAEVQGRPKHIYSIYNKMHKKKLEFSQLYDIRAVRVLVRKVSQCYKALDIVNTLWQPILEEYDDYINRPKGNNYQSLHTAVRADDGRALEVQIRTYDMHQHAEFGVAAHWRYKEGGGAAGGYDDKIALLRSLLSWRDEVADSADWVEQTRKASLDDTLYLLTPQGRVIDLPRGATPVDFAYRLHTEVGHRCRGAKVDGQLVPLHTRLESGQTVEIVTTKEGGPSRDWLNPQQGYIATGRARSKIRQYFSQLEHDEVVARGRAFITRELQREGQTQANLEQLAERLGFKSAESMFVFSGRGEVGPQAVRNALHREEGPQPASPSPGEDSMVVGRSRSQGGSGQVLIDGVGDLMTTLGRCCKPAPPDAIKGFVTRTRGVSVHRVDCGEFQRLSRQAPERVVPAEWGESAFKGSRSVFPVDLEVEAMDRQGLLRDISDVLSREKLNVTAVNTASKKGRAIMRFTMEVTGTGQVQRAIKLIQGVSDIEHVRRK